MSTNVSWRGEAAYLVVALILFAPMAAGQSVITRDLLHFIYPMVANVGQALSEGRALLWDETVFHGVPLLARWEGGVLYPPQWLAVLLPVPLALGIGAALHLVLAASATRRLALRYTEHAGACWLAGLSYGFGGYLITMIGGSVSYLYGPALLPCGLLIFHRLLERPCLARGLQLACVLALQILVPDPQVLFYQLSIVFPVIWLVRGRGSRLRVAPLAALAGLLALALAACQLLPTLEFASLSTRNGGLAYADAAVWSLHPARLLEVVVPGLFGDISTENTFWARSMINARQNTPWASSIYLGILPLLGLLAITRRGGRRDLWLWLGLTVLFLLLAFGSWTPFHQLFWRVVPGADRFRYPEKFMALVHLGLAILASRGLAAVLSDDSAARRRLIMGGGVTLLVVAGARLWFTEGLHAEGWFSAVVAEQGARVNPSLALDATRGALARVFAFILVSTAAIWVLPRLRPKLRLPLLGLVAAADLLTAAVPFMIWGDNAWVMEEPRACRALPPARGGTLPFIWRGHLKFNDRLSVARSGSRIQRQRRWEHATLKPNVAAHHCGRYAAGYDAAILARHERLIRSLLGRPRRLLEVLGVDVVVSRSGSTTYAGLPLINRLPRLGIELRGGPGRPFSYGVGRVRHASDFAAALDAIADPKLDLKSEVVLESPGDEARASYPAAERAVTRARYLPGVIELRADFHQPGYLVVLESRYPGWGVTVDGEPAELLSANGIFMAVHLRRGAHDVRLLFDPPLQRRANWISLAALAFVIAASLVLVLRRRLATPG